MKDLLLARRRFLKVAAAGTAWPFLATSAAGLAAEPTRKPLTAAQFRERMRGPILSIPTPFTRDYAIDKQSINTMVARASAAGVKIFSLTAGNGQYAYLTDAEIFELTRMLAEAVGDKGITIAAARGGWTDQVADYARFSASVGAHAVQVFKPDGCDDDAVVEHFRKVADACGLPIVLFGEYSPALIKKLIEIPAVAAMKEDATLDYYIDRQREFGDRLIVFGGGSEHRFLVAQPYGSDCYYSAYTPFAPQVSMDFWEMIKKGDQKGAVAWTNKFDYPFLDRWSHGFWRASMELFGTGQRYLRPPVRSFTDEQMKEAKAFYEGLGLKNA